MAIRLWHCAALVAFTIAPLSVASAQAPGTGFEAGLRSGYALSMGKVSGDSDDELNDEFSSAVPIWLDVGYRALPELFVGAYGHYAFTFMNGRFGELCEDPRADCSVSDVRIGVQAHYHPAPESLANPWVGLGFGYEWLAFGLEANGSEASLTLHGFELVHLQAGLDFEVSEHFFLGPVISFSLGQYASASIECSSPVASACDSVPTVGIEDTALHEWLTFAVRGAYAP